MTDNAGHDLDPESGLTRKQRLFCDSYLTHLNPRLAYNQAGCRGTRCMPPALRVSISRPAVKVSSSASRRFWPCCSVWAWTRTGRTGRVGP